MRGGGGILEAKTFKESIKQDWNFQRGGASNRKKKNICGRGMDIFWNNTMFVMNFSTGHYYPKVSLRIFFLGVKLLALEHKNPEYNFTYLKFKIICME